MHGVVASARFHITKCKKQATPEQRGVEQRGVVTIVSVPHMFVDLLRRSCHAGLQVHFFRSFLHSFILSFLHSFIHSLKRSFMPWCIVCFLHSFFRAVFPSNFLSFHLSFVADLVSQSFQPITIPISNFFPIAISLFSKLPPRHVPGTIK